MKDIMVAIDFSKGSVHALEYAIELANVTQSNIIMVWVDNQSIQELPISSESYEYREESKKNLEELVATYKGKMNSGKISFKIRKGKVYQELAAQAKQSDASLLITGTHGVTGFEEYWIGSNAARVVSNSPCPVISVKFNFDVNRGIRKILFPVTHIPETIQKSHITAKLAGVYGADVILLAIHASKLKTMQRVVDNNITKVEKYFASQGINYMVDSVFSDNLSATIIEHARTEDIDLISVITDWQNDSSVTILGQFAQQLVNFSPVPVLSIHPKDNFVL